MESLIGKKVIVRTYSAGVHYGTLESLDGKQAVLSDTRRIWYWEGAFTLSAVAQKGVSQASKISVVVPQIVLTEAIEVISCSAAAAANLDGIKAHEPR